MRYQMKWFGEDDTIDYRMYKNFSYPLHLHRSLEYIYLDSGILTVVQSGKKFDLKEGQSVLFLPNEIHGYESKKNCIYHSIVFSPDMVPIFIKNMENKKAVSPIFRVEERFLNNSALVQKLLCSKLKARGLLMMLCGNYLEQVEFIDKEAGNQDLMSRIIDYVGRNFTENITLKSLAEELGYDHAYISRFISQKMGITFHRYLTELRLTYAVDLLQAGDEKISTIAMQSGFSSIRSFNHNFQKKFEMSPKDYVKSNDKI